MQYLLASDLHYELRQLDWIATQAADFDAVVLAGDHLDVAGRVDLNAQIALMLAYFKDLADKTTVIANSGNHDLTERRLDGEKAAMWMADTDSRVATDGATIRVGSDVVSVCAWWEGPHSLGELERQLEVDSQSRGEGCWIWAYHSPPDVSPTSWSGKQHFGDDVLNRLIAKHTPDVVLTGHVHNAPFHPDGAWHDQIGETVVINAGRQSGHVPAHVILDTETRTAEWWTFTERGDFSF